MTPEIQQQLDAMQEQINALRSELDLFKSAAELDPQVVYTLGLIFSKDSGQLVTDYDRNVNEGGVATYNVPKQFDGLMRIGTKLVGYYNPL